MNLYIISFDEANDLETQTDLGAVDDRFLTHETFYEIVSDVEEELNVTLDHGGSDDIYWLTLDADGLHNQVVSELRTKIFEKGGFEER